MRKVSYKNKWKNGGYTLAEMLIYIGILSFTSLVVVSMLLSFTGSYKNVTALRAAETSGIYSMERMMRDIKSATSIDLANSTLGGSPGVLTIISTYSGVSTTTRFYVQDGILRVDINGSYYGPLTGNNTTVTSLTFRSLNSGVSTAVKIDLGLRGTTGTINKDKTYHNTVILSGTN